jgi:hypothetical protein
MSLPGRIAVAAMTLAAVVVGVLQWHARATPPMLGFWFRDDVTFALHDERRLGGGALTADEQQRIQAIARSEVERAFQPFGLLVVDHRDAPYRVVVEQEIRPGWGSPVRFTGAAGQTYMLGPFGNFGAVNFTLLAAQAMGWAPSDATRADIVDAIGRGIGRAAVHEFGHQLLPRDRMHRTDDETSYEFGSANRRAQYYGELHWSHAGPKLRAMLMPR